LVLQRLEADRIAETVERYCAAGHADEDADLIEAQIPPIENP
jgi:hypothetical protein